MARGRASAVHRSGDRVQVWSPRLKKWRRGVVNGEFRAGDPRVTVDLQTSPPTTVHVEPPLIWKHKRPRNAGKKNRRKTRAPAVKKTETRPDEATSTAISSAAAVTPLQQQPPAAAGTCGLWGCTLPRMHTGFCMVTLCQGRRGRAVPSPPPLAVASGTPHVEAVPPPSSSSSQGRNDASQSDASQSTAHASVEEEGGIGDDGAAAAPTDADDVSMIDAEEEEEEAEEQAPTAVAASSGNGELASATEHCTSPRTAAGTPPIATLPAEVVAPPSPPALPCAISQETEVAMDTPPPPPPAAASLPSSSTSTSTDPCASLRAAAEQKGLSLEMYTGRKLPERLAAEALALARRNMAPITTTWDEKRRAADLAHDQTKVLLLRRPTPGASGASGDAAGGGGGGGRRRGELGLLDLPPVPPPRRASRGSSSSSSSTTTTTAAPSAAAATPPPLITAQDSSVIGFASFRFVTQETLSIAYLFELHLEENLRRQGLGTRLVDAVRTFGRNAKKRGVLLTVHHTNVTARSFYVARGLNVAPISPSMCAPPNVASLVDYDVMQDLWDDEAVSVMEARGELARRVLHERAEVVEGGGAAGAAAPGAE